MGMVSHQNVGDVGEGGTNMYWAIVNQSSEKLINNALPCRLIKGKIQLFITLSSQPFIQASYNLAIMPPHLFSPTATATKHSFQYYCSLFHYSESQNPSHH